MYLVINTLAEEDFQIGLADKQGRLISSVTKKGRFIQAEKLLPAIDHLINKKYNYRSLSGVIVAKGPGGFTSIRIGVVTANTFAYALQIPIVGFLYGEFKDFADLANKGVEQLSQGKNDEIVTPFYGREPNITKAKPQKF